jgi:hypothetical protein
MADTNKAEDRISVVMTARSWMLMLQIVVSHIHDMIKERDDVNSFLGPTEDSEDLEHAIREMVQKLLPVMHEAADKTEFPGIADELKSTIQQMAGFVIPEHHEDMAKRVVINLTEEWARQERQTQRLRDAIKQDSAEKMK